MNANEETIDVPAETRPDEYIPDGVAFTLDDVTSGRMWKHYRGGVYTTIAVIHDSTNGAREGTAYVLYAGGTMCIREASQFLDGRFRPMPKAST